MRELSSNYLSKRGKKYNQISLILQIIIYLKIQIKNVKPLKKRKRKKNHYLLRDRIINFGAK